MATINVLELTEADTVKSGDTLLLIRPGTDGTQKAYRVDGAHFKGDKGADGDPYNVDNISATMKRNRLTLTV